MESTQTYIIEKDPIFLDSEASNFVTGDKSKLDWIQSWAEVNVNADWSSTSWDSQILNKPTIPTPWAWDGAVQFNNAGIFTSDDQFIFDATTKSLKIGDAVNLLPDNPLWMQRLVDSYLQVNIKNDSDWTSASADYIITANDWDDTQFYADFWLGNSNYASEVWDAMGAHDMYMMCDWWNVVIGSLSTGKEIKFFIAGTEHEAHPTDIVAKIDADWINLPIGKTFRINWVDITTAGMTNPMTATGDIIYWWTAGIPTKLTKWTDWKILKMVSWLPSWESEWWLADWDYGDVSVSSWVITIDNSVVTEAKMSITDLTTNNATTLKHGFLPKLSWNATQVLLWDWTFWALPWLTKDTIWVTVDWAGTVVSTGSKGYKVITEDCTITGWTILWKESWSVVIDIKKCTYAWFPTTSSIAWTEKPTLSSAQKNQDNTLTTWTTSLTAWDILEFIVDSATTITRFNLFINIQK